jgi:hypothetical protein
MSKKSPKPAAGTPEVVNITAPVQLSETGYGALPFVQRETHPELGPWITAAQIDDVTQRIQAAGLECQVIGLRAYAARFADDDDAAAEILEVFESRGSLEGWAPDAHGFKDQGWTLVAVLRDDPGAIEADAVAIMARAPSVESHATTFLVGNLMEAAARRYKGLAVPWSQLSEHEQSTLLRNQADDVRAAVAKAIKAIASNQRLTFRAEVAKVEFKGASDITATLKLASGKESHALADSAGGFVTVVIEQVDELLQVTDTDTKGEPDQKALFDAGTAGRRRDEGPASDGAGRRRRQDEDHGA